MKDKIIVSVLRESYFGLIPRPNEYHKDREPHYNRYRSEKGPVKKMLTSQDAPYKDKKNLNSNPVLDTNICEPSNEKPVKDLFNLEDN